MEEKARQKEGNGLVSLLGLIEDIYLLQEQAVIQEHGGSLSQNLEDDP